MNHRFILFFWALALSLVASLAQAVTCNASMPPASNPDSAYTDNGNGTVTHTPTGLTWKRCAEGQTWSGGTCSGSATSHTWGQALAQAANSSFAGQMDWRLPDIKELRSLVEECRIVPSINDTIFPNAPGSFFWSDSPGASISDSVRGVNFDGGGAGYALRSGNVNAVRLVRGGQSFDSLGTNTAPSCILTASPASITAGGTSTLTASCSPAATSYVWTGGSCAGTTGATTCTVTPSSTTTYTVAGINAGGTGTEASATVTVKFSSMQPNADGTVFDPKTGLTWMRCSMGQVWNGSTCLGTAGTYTFDQANALTSTTTFADQSDWRVPNIRELQTIVDRSVYNPAIDSTSFPNTPSSLFWSGSPDAGYSNGAWGVYFNYGGTYDGANGVSRDRSYAVRLVRGGQTFGSLLGITRTTSDYVDNRNGTVTHTPTNLTWKRCPELQTWTGSTCSGTATNFTFDQATALADTTTFAGQSDWRLPTEDELLSLVDYSTYAPAINSSIFPATPSSHFWSGSPDAYISSYAWYVGFMFGYGHADGDGGSIAVRLVRGGQPSGTFVLAVSKSGTGTGTVTGSVAGINCGSTCSAALASGTSVTLTATPATGSNFTGWSGSCSGRGSCTVSMDAVKSVTALFMAAPTTSKLQPNADGTVTDLKTGLTWMRCAMGQVWNGSTCIGTASPYTFDQANALTGTTTFANQSDWRMPNIRELQTIVDRSVSGSAIDSVAFPNASSSYFWSGSPYADGSNYAWDVSFGDGHASSGNRSYYDAVRLVRGGQSFGPLLGITRPTSDYVDNGNGTVTHTPTNLTWKRCTQGQTWTGSTCSGTASTYTFDQANALTGTTTFAGRSDWRVPTDDELVSLVDYSIASPGPTINSSVFPATPSSGFWSGSPHAYYSSYYAWYVYFGDGYASSYYRSYNDAVRLVRGGQSFGSFVLVVSKSGTGTGTVTGSAAGINCGSTCSAALTSGASVTLTATPATGSTFIGWSGACSGTGTCTVSMTAAQNVTAAFTNACTYALNANSATAAATAGTGSISVTSSCAWTAASNASWLTITSGASGSGNGTVAYAVAANTGTTQRTGTLTIAGQTFTVTQAAGSTVTAPVCTLSANPSSITSGGSSTLTATCNPTATSYIWMGGSCAGTSGASCTVSPTATTTYSVQGSNAGGTNQAAGATVTVTANTASYTVPGTLGNDVFVLTAGNNYYGGAGNDTFIISPNTLLGGVTAKIIDTEGDNLIQLVDGMTVAASSFYSDAAQITLSNGAIVQILGASKFKFQVGANALAGDTAAVLTYSEFVSSLGASLSGTLPASGTAGYVVPTGFTQAAAPVPSVAGSSYTVSGTLGDDVLVPSGGNSYLGGGGNDVYIISPYTLSGLVTAKIIDSEGGNVIQLVGGLTIASSTFFSNAVQLMLSNTAIVQILGASGFSYQLGANAPAGVTASSLSYAQFAAALGASVPAAGAAAVSGSANFVVPSP